MAYSTIARKKRPGKLVYGYRIRVRRDNQASTLLPTIFAATPPELWATLQAEKDIESMALYRRGRLVDQYTRAIYS